MTSGCDATSHIYMINGLKSQWGIVCVPHKSTKYRVGIQVMRPTPCGAIIQMHPSTTTTTTLQLFNINIKVKRQEKGLEVTSCYIQTNTKPWHIHPPPPPPLSLHCHSLIFKRTLRTTFRIPSPKVPSYQS